MPSIRFHRKDFMKSLDKRLKMSIMALSTEHGARSTDRIAMPFFRRAVITEYIERIDMAGAFCPGDSVCFFVI